MNIITFMLRPVLQHIIFLEHRIMTKLDDATARLEAGIAANATQLAAAQAAISSEITDLANAIANGTAGEGDAIAARLNAVADKLDANTQALVDSTNQLTSDDAPVVPQPPQS